MASGIDNDEPFFQFDPYDEQRPIVSAYSQESSSAVAISIPARLPSRGTVFTSVELTRAVGTDSEDVTIQGKGKARSIPMPIQSSITVHDIFDGSPMSASSTSTSYMTFGSPSSMAFSPSSSSNFSTPEFERHLLRHRTFSGSSMEDMQTPEHLFESPESPSSRKGKERESFPVLPPLTFSMIELGYEDSNISSSPGSSSYGTTHSPSVVVSLPAAAALTNVRGSTASSRSQSPSPDRSVISQDATSRLHLSRCRSMSSFSTRPLSPLLGIVASAAASPPVLLGSTQPSSNISRQLVRNDKHGGSNFVDKELVPSTTPTTSDIFALETEPGAYTPAWYTVSKSLVNSPTTIIQTQPLPVPNPSPHVFLNRSKTSPYPASALDFVPVVSCDVFQPLPLVVFNYFDLLLPNELRLRILHTLVELHEEDHERSVHEGRLTMAKAVSSRNRWVGRDKAIKELFKLSRVSKAWRALIFDGELWADLDLSSFPGLPTEIIVRLIKSAGTFIRRLNLAGHIPLLPAPMLDITNSLCLELLFPYTQLTSVNFQGCSKLTTRSLHHLLVRSRSLESLCLKGLTAVTNTTCDIIANFCPNITSLNLSRCPNLDAHGISALTVAAVLHSTHLPLKELRISGLKYVSDTTMQGLGRAFPYLEVLDLSYARTLHNSALDAFVACDSPTDQAMALKTVAVSPRDLGREVSEYGKLTRRVTRLRHLNVSFCIMLTDMACANLAHSVPDLEFLEMAGIGADLKDDGLIRLLSTTLNVRRLDFEDAVDVTDALLAAITPVPAPPVDASSTTVPRRDEKAEKQPGHLLEQFNLSHAREITDQALLALIRNCPKLVALELDDTRVGTKVLREFVALSRQRKTQNARLVAVDCRAVTESVVKDLAPHTRPRLGWRAYGARKLGYLDARDDNEDELRVGQDECDPSRVVLKTFYSWQTVDAVKAARDKRRKMNSSAARRAASEGDGGTSASAVAGEAVEATQAATTGARSSNSGSVGRSGRWWSPGGRRATAAGGTVNATTAFTRGRNSPSVLPDLNSDGCRTM